MQLNDLNVVLAVAEHNSITAAAKQLDISTSSASMAVKRVEQWCGAELFVRSTRQLRLSAIGQRYLPEFQQALAQLTQAQAGLENDLSQLQGQLRIAVSSDLGRNGLRQWLNGFLSTHANLQLRLHVSDSQVDFYRDGVDVALRYISSGALDDANLYGFKLADVPHLLVASPHYLKQHGAPQLPEDLAQHNCLLYQLYDVVADRWRFSKDGQTQQVKVRSNRIANDGDLVRRWCVDGEGIAIKSAIDVAEDLKQGRLVTLMPDYRPSGTELWLVLPSRQLITPAIRTLRSELTAYFAQVLGELEATHPPKGGCV